MNIKKYFGPSTLVTAAFIGPGTITTCTLAGIKEGNSLLWAMMISILATIILQEMSARLGLITGRGLGEALRLQFKKGIGRYIVFFLVISAIVIGNAAYEAGNISGGALGIELLFNPSNFWPILVGLLCGGLLYSGKFQWIERFLLGTVILMSLSFFVTLLIIQPSFSDIIKGFIPFAPDRDEFLLIMGIIGTTVVPYNLFLQASTVSKKWHHASDLHDLRIENAIAILLGGVISMMIIITAAASSSEVDSVNSAADMAVQLEPLYGPWAKYLMAVGLFAAGISSALTAPLAASYAAKGLFGWSDDEKTWNFRSIWMLIILVGVIVSIFDFPRVLVIKFAQITNAILLPIIAIYLLKTCNEKSIMGDYRNKFTTNLLGGSVVLITLLLSFRTLNNIFHLL